MERELMKYITIIASLMLAAITFGSTLSAQDDTRNWENGYVMDVTHVHVKDGKFNAYMNDLNNVWRKFMEKGIKNGNIISYGMFSNDSNREGEPNLILTVTYKNWAVFDMSQDELDKIGKEVFGSLEKGRSANVNRGELRTIGTNLRLQEIKFKD